MNQNEFEELSKKYTCNDCEYKNIWESCPTIALNICGDFIKREDIVC